MCGLSEASRTLEEWPGLLLVYRPRVQPSGLQCLLGQDRLLRPHAKQVIGDCRVQAARRMYIAPDAAFAQQTGHLTVHLTQLELTQAAATVFALCLQSRSAPTTEAQNEAHLLIRRTAGKSASLEVALFHSELTGAFSQSRRHPCRPPLCGGARNSVRKERRNPKMQLVRFGRLALITSLGITCFPLATANLCKHGIHRV